VTLDEALQVSCNTTFAKLGEFVSADEFAEYSQRFLLLENAGLPLASKAGGIGEFTGDNRKVLLAESLFGQGQMQVTPLAIARMTLMIAGGGSAPKPYLVERVAGPSGRTLYRARTQQMEAAVSAESAATVAGMMVNVVEEGTGQVASLSGVEVAGKTGSAENPHGQAHSWFTAFAPAEAPQVVVTVVVENAGAGSEAAGPIVRELMEYLLD
jgi:peptidoglycan glycosyltransferase